MNFYGPILKNLHMKYVRTKRIPTQYKLQQCNESQKKAFDTNNKNSRDVTSVL